MFTIKKQLASLLERAVKLGKAAAFYAAKIGMLVLKHRVPAMIIGAVLTLAMLMSVITVSVHQVIVLEDGEQIASYYAVMTDEASVLERNDLTLGDGDELRRTEEKGVITVMIARAFPIEIAADGKTVTVLLASGTVADALAKAGITANEADLLEPAADTALAEGIKITLDRVSTDTVIETESIDYETKKIKTDELYVGQSEVVQEGKKGSKKLTYSVTYINGEESERELIAEEITEEPTDKLVKVGTKIKSSFKKTASTPKSYKKVIAMTATAYSAGGTTASGLPAKVGVVAVDPRVIPLGTKVYVETADGKYIYGEAIAADTGGAIKGNKIDICVNTRAEAYAFGRRTVNVYILY